MRLTDIRLIRSAEYVALRPGEGTCVERLRELTITDGRAIPDLSPLADLLGDPAVVKVIHNATFERWVLSPLTTAREAP